MASNNHEEAKIRKEWLKFKGALYDHSVDFPTIPIIIDDVRKNIENSGFSVAIDDVGAGYSSLHTIAELKPVYLKYDMALVRDINKHTIKSDLLESLIPFSKKINTIIIAEGIETKDEFEVLKEIGIEYGQGFFFGKLSRLLKNEI